MLKLNTKITKKKIFLSILLVIFLYLMVVLNLFKATGKIEWNIFMTDALPKFVLFCVVVVPLIYFIKAKKK